MRFCDEHDQVDRPDDPCPCHAPDWASEVRARLEFLRWLRYDGEFIDDDGSVNHLVEHTEPSE